MFEEEKENEQKLPISNTFASFFKVICQHIEVFRTIALFKHLFAF